MCASLSPCGKYLIFSRFTDGKSDLYWINTSIIDKLNAKSSALNKDIAAE
jgi:hypothetical protein